MRDYSFLRSGAAPILPQDRRALFQGWSFRGHYRLGYYLRPVRPALYHSRLHSIFYRWLFREDVGVYHHLRVYPDRHRITAPRPALLAQSDTSSWRDGLSDSDYYISAPRDGRG